MTLVSRHVIYIDDGYSRCDKYEIEVRRVGETFDLFLTRNGRPQSIRDEEVQRVSFVPDKK